jgi:type III restriction enzyme
VRASGLIKDWVTVHHPEHRQASDTTLLRAAAEQAGDFKKRWSAYTKKQKEQPVEPLLVVQVEDASASGGLSRTNIAEASSSCSAS